MAFDENCKIAQPPNVRTIYSLLAHGKEFWHHQALHALILNKAQAIKNPKSRGASAAVQLRAVVSLALISTPVENNL